MTLIWKERSVEASSIDALVAVGYSPLQARILSLRGVKADTVNAFFNSSLADLAKPTDLPGIKEAASIILDAIKAKKKIIIFGDYDCDGVCATSIMVQTLTALNALVEPFLPERLSEGYGMNNASIDRLLKEHPGVSLVVTVDNGINSIDQVALLKSYGIDVIVTDHHLPSETLPQCLVINPKVSSPKHLEMLCGAGVAFLLAAEIISQAKECALYSGPNIGGPLLVMAGLATVTDIMPIVGQNRILVTESLKHFRSWAPLGLRELLDRASRTATTSLSTRDFGFLIGPRINAAGRIASGMEAVELVLERDREQARKRAHAIDLHNARRKSIEQKMTESAVAQIEKGATAQVIFLSSQDEAHSGIAGIVAARILERLGTSEAVPVAVIVDRLGSARSPEGYHIRNALQASKEALERFGGHAAAGGLTVKEGEQEKFRKLFKEACAKQAEEMPSEIRGVVFADAQLEASDITLDFANWIQTLEPFGEANNQPLFLLKSVYIADAKTLGSDGKHLQLSFKGNYPRAVWWSHGFLIDQLHSEAGDPHDILCTLEISTYGEAHVELRIQDIKK